MKNIKTAVIGLALAASICLTSFEAKAQSTEERFQDIFVTAGYATAFGAALGAATLSFYDNPQDHLQYVAVGASLGFIGGSLLGSYIVFSPMIAENPTAAGTLLSSGQVPEKGLAIRPTFNPDGNRLTQVEGAWTITNF